MRTYLSKLAPYIEALIKEKQASGFRFIMQSYRLEVVDRFIIENKFDNGTISRDLVAAFARQKPTENRNTRNDRVSALKLLATYMKSLRMSVISPESFASGDRSIPYLPTNEELIALFTVIDEYVPHQNKLARFGLVYPVLFRLFYCCGLRLSEGCYLKNSCVNLTTGVLTIEQTKGRNDRLVYLAEDVMDLCRRYNTAISKIIPNRQWFFPGWDPQKPFSKTAIDLKFRQFWNKAYSQNTSKRPTIHSLRYCFIMNKINEWITEGLNIDVMMPYLSRYVGHSSIQESYYYYHQMDSRTPALRMHIEANGTAVPKVVPYEN